MIEFRLTEYQKDLLIDKTWDGFQFFNPYQNFDDYWVISSVEYYGCTIEQQVLLGIDSWFNNLPEIPYNPKPVNLEP